jgi:KaiC/GvpD/RAD55 family RecA-like ATPase
MDMTENGPGTASTGDEVLDGMLGGGIPRDRAVLFAGGPGTGKSTLALQFLQAGLADGERGLFVSTEQTFEELHDSFSGFAFDLDHPNLDFATVHAGVGRTIEGGEEELVLRALGEGEGLLGEDRVLGGEFGAPFTVRHLKQYLDVFAPCDRVVFDSVSGLAAMAEEDRFRRTVLELIQFFSRDHGATSVLTAEADDDGAVKTPLRYNIHGVVELRRTDVDDDPHRRLEVTKLRGVDHDRRPAELQFRDGRARVAPTRRSQPPELKTHRHTPVGVPGLDALCGGGLVTGAGVLLRHDGYVNLAALFGALLDAAVERGFTTVLVPTIRLRPAGVRHLLEERGHDVARLFEDDRLFVLDPIGAWDEARENVFGSRETAAGVISVLDEIADHAGDDPTFSLINADAMLNTLGSHDAREVRYHQESRLVGDEDLLVHVNNPGVAPDQSAQFYVNTAEQVLETWLTDDGLQYLSLDKSPCGFVGTTSLVEYSTKQPYVEVQHPPHDRETPHARGSDAE